MLPKLNKEHYTMNISTMFKLVKAPLRNDRWSWGAVRKDGSVVLRTDAHDFVGEEVQVFGPTWTPGRGKDERSLHLSIAKGFFCIMYISSNPGERGTIQSFDKRELWYGNELRTDDNGNTWLKLLHRVPVGNLL
jgi:hypothetical protein